MTVATPDTESAERLARPLIRLAKAHDIATSYIDQLGAYVEIDDDVLVDVLAALGVNAADDDAVARALAAVEGTVADAASDNVDTIADVPDGKRLLSKGTIVMTAGESATVALDAPADADPHATITLEDGTVSHSELADIIPDINDGRQFLALPQDLPIGYHTLHVEADGRSADATIMVAPTSIPVPAAVADHPRWGWMHQLYTARSAASWGVGDYGDLRTLAADAGRSGADFLLINPIHAGAPVSPLEPSPYLPESRRFLNVTYIRPQDIPEYAALDEAGRARVEELHESVAWRNESAEPLDINASWTAKRKALRIIFDQPRTAEREAVFTRFKEQAGEDLVAFAAWCVAFEVWGAPWEEDSWFTRTDRTSPEVAELVRDHHDLFEFNRWLQWIADEQVAAAHAATKDAGMALGLMQDMAVGVHAYGSDVWWSPERFALGSVTVGCPPDFYNQQGQDWGQPPFNPRYLDRTGYRVYRDMVHAMFAHAGAVRIDHALGLFRLWWIPRGKGAKGGAYVTYDHEAMIAVWSIEAMRADGMVIGEDLGTVPDYVRDILKRHGVLGTDVEWFARVDDSPNAGDPYAPPQDYRRQALASVTTHDLPPTAGYLDFEHVRLREELGLLASSVDEFQESASAERQAMLDLLVDGGWIDAADAAVTSPAGGVVDEQAVVEAMHRMLSATPSLLRQATLMDGVGQHAAVNQPGTSTEYANWRVPLQDAAGRVVPSDRLFADPRVTSLAAVMRGER